MDKTLIAVGAASKTYTSLESAAHDTYTLTNGHLTPTPLTFEGNPYNPKILSAKCIFEIGCGVGRNVPWIMEHTKAQYIAVEPNDTMREHFYQENASVNKVFRRDWAPRCRVFKNFEQLNAAGIPSLDVVVSTFVYQHISYRPQPPAMNIADITAGIRNHTHKGTVWFLYEHEFEEPGWLSRWLFENNFTRYSVDRQFERIPELLHRGPHTMVLAEE